MAIGIKVDFLWYSIGEPDFLFSFFSTIAVRLENQKWGSKYPTIMKKLYSGSLDYVEIDKADSELKEIKKELSNFKPNQIIWDAEDLSKNPPWGGEISSDITSLQNYFITSDGRNLIEVFEEAFYEAKVEKVSLIIKQL